MTYQILLGNNLDVLPTLHDNSVDSIVTDPPYELGFMGKKWDSSGIAYSVELWQQCLRVLKPGGHLLSFGGTRTYHRVAVAIEDAGFELRDSIAWLYGSGFPKSMDVSKAIDKAAGAEREVIGTKIASPKGISQAESRSDSAAGAYGGESKEIDITTPSTLEAKQWEGWGTALKPAFEPVIVARKPIEGTVANNVLKWGTGGLNIGGSRIGRQDGDNSSAGNRTATFGTQDTNSGGDGSGGWTQNDSGRWPANIILDPYTAELLDEQSGTLKDGVAVRRNTNPDAFMPMSVYGKYKNATTDSGYGGSGGASRFFYVAKASKRDRNEGLEELDATRVWDTSRKPENIGSNTPQNRSTEPRKNFHPTVKPTSLMEYLINLVTPPNGTVLDPFTGSGSTGKAAILQGFDFIGIEMTEEYLPIIEGRLKHAEQMVAEAKEQDKVKASEVLF
jgi:site-specific DNA-methyltransferase (adenine-specific)